VYNPNESDESGGGDAGITVSIRRPRLFFLITVRRAVRSPPVPLQIWSPIMEISTCRPHDEHFIVGMKLDSRIADIVEIRVFQLPSLEFPCAIASKSVVLSLELVGPWSRGANNFEVGER
jgi:hypothetical protein